MKESCAGWRGSFRGEGFEAESDLRTRPGAVKVDDWDVDALADAIYGLIKYPALSGMFASKGLEEVTNLKWNDAAAKIKSVYEAVIEENKKQLK